MHIAIITAGGAGMFCGSCMHDNTLARALLDAGEQVSLLPTYTPLRLDETDVSARRVFLGGVNVYLDAMLPGWSRIPKVLKRWLDHPRLLRWATQFGVSPDAAKLGRLTLATLQGDGGPEAQEVEELARYVGRELRPDVLLFSNALLAGALAAVRREFSGRVFCVLQGDDIFLNALIEPYRSRALELLRKKSTFDGFVVHSQYYRDFMSELLGQPRESFTVVPLGIDLRGHTGLPRPTAGRPFTVGYFARICPEKGLHQLVRGFRILHARQPETRLVAGGYLGPRDQAYLQQLLRDARDLGPAFEYVGSPETHAEKVDFLKTLDVLSVPTEYHEPKGLYVLEAWANGVPVVQPRHGAFPEMVSLTGGGLLTTPGDEAELAQALEQLLLQPELRYELAQRGHAGVARHYSREVLAAATLAALGR